MDAGIFDIFINVGTRTYIFFLYKYHNQLFLKIIY